MLTVIWDPTVTAFEIGNFGVRWYSLFWMIGLLLGYVVMAKLYQKQNIPQDKFDSLFIYCIIGILLGARLGHCLLYEPNYFLAHPIEMFLPIRNITGIGWKLTGYQGLASHGGTFGLMIALWLYVRKYKINLMRVLDDIAIATPITAACIRFGNLMNSEIVGKTTNTMFAFVFVQNGENFGRHPAQLYEGLWYLLLFFIGLALYTKYKAKVGTGYFFGWVLTTIFAFRFVVEYYKEVQEAWEQTMVATIGLNQGQILSIPFIILGLYCWMGGKYCLKFGEKKTDSNK